MRVKFNRQKIIAFTIAYMVSFLALLNGINAITNSLGFNTTMDTLALYVIMWIMAIFVWVNAMTKSYFKMDVFWITLTLTIMLICTLLFFPQNTKYILSSAYTFSDNPVLILFVYAFTGYIAIRCLDKYQYLIQYLRVFSYVIVIISTIVFLEIKDSFANQYMTLSYNMLLQVCFLLEFPPSKKKWLNYIIVGVGMFIIIVGGARGAMMGLLTAIVLKMLGNQSRFISFKKVVISFFSVGILGYVLSHYEQLIIGIYKFTTRNGLTSRTLDLMLYSTEDISSGRFEMFSEIFEQINLVGYGLYGDRVVLGENYAHNLFLEWIVEFGLILGGLLVFVYIMLLALGLKKSNGVSKRLMLIFIPNGLIALMFSGSYLGQQPAFYILLGLCVNSILACKNKGNLEL